MAAAWYYLKDDAEHGPLSTQQLREMVSDQRLGPADLVRRDGLAGWTRVEDVPGLTPGTIVEVTPNLSASHSMAADLGKQAIEQAKAIGQGTWQALRDLLTDPLGQLGQTLEKLGEGAAWQVGLVFLGVFVLSGWWAGATLPREWFGEDAAGFGFHVKLWLLSLVPPIALTFSLLGVGQAAGAGNAGARSCLFLAGTCSLPLIVVAWAAILLGWGNAEALAAVALLGQTVFVLLLYAALVTVQQLSTRKALLLVPTLVLIVVYATKLAFTRLFSA